MVGSRRWLTSALCAPRNLAQGVAQLQSARDCHFCSPDSMKSMKANLIWSSWLFEWNKLSFHIRVFYTYYNYCHKILSALKYNWHIFMLDRGEYSQHGLHLRCEEAIQRQSYKTPCRFLSPLVATNRTTTYLPIISICRFTVHCQVNTDHSWSIVTSVSF